jgi:malate dehydrogenase (oxaloacetate-decarboxylating)(NADP+)
MPKKTPKLSLDALAYHSHPKPGKLEVFPSKPLITQDDLSLAYTPGVADVCNVIKDDPSQAGNLTIKSNLVAVITNGTAVLGLGNIGPLASKPVMEGKAVLFKNFAQVDCFDIEVEENDPHKLIDICAGIAPTFGGINLEDIKAPECFIVEKELQKRLDIPVFHDDQHGTAIIFLAGIINATKLNKKKKSALKVVCNGAGAAGLACMKMLHAWGVPKKNITMVDIDGVVYQGREQMNEYIEEFAVKTKKRTLTQVIDGADIFLGVSVGNVLKPEMVKKMAKNPVIFAMANPTPEIMPEIAKKARPDAIIGTGRSDFPNQINNVLCFPYMFRGALDVEATCVNDEMKIAAAEAIAGLARQTADHSLTSSYKNAEQLKFGPEYIIPKPFDPRLLSVVSPAVAKAAMESGVARKPLADLSAYTESLRGRVDQSFGIMRQVFMKAKSAPQRVIFPEGEDERVLRAAQQVINEGIARPIIIGREKIVKEQLKKSGVTIKPGKDFEFIDPNTYDKLDHYAEIYYGMRKRSGMLPPEAAIALRSRWTALGAVMLHENDADAMVVGVTGRFSKFSRAIQPIIKARDGIQNLYALQLVMHKGRMFFIGDTNVNVDPTPEQIAEMTKLAHEEVKHFGMEPRFALLSHSHFGSHENASAEKMRQAYRLIRDNHPEILVEGEMQADAALNMEIMERTFPDSKLQEPANVLMMPNLDSANIAFNMVRSIMRSGETVGPILLGMEKPVHILNVSASVRQIVNMTALAVVEASAKQES